MRNNSGQEFMVKTRYENISPSPQSEGLIPQPPLELPLSVEQELIPLPKGEEIYVPPMDVRAAIESRRTLRKYAYTPLDFEELAYLLWVSQGVKRVSPRPSTARTVSHSTIGTVEVGKSSCITVSPQSKRMKDAGNILFSSV